MSRFLMIGSPVKAEHLVYSRLGQLPSKAEEDWDQLVSEDDLTLLHLPDSLDRPGDQISIEDRLGGVRFLTSTEFADHGLEGGDGRVE